MSPSFSDIFTSVPHARSVRPTPVVSQLFFPFTPPPDARLHASTSHARTPIRTRPAYALPFSRHTSHTPLQVAKRARLPRPSPPTHGRTQAPPHRCTPAHTATRGPPRSASRAARSEFPTRELHSARDSPASLSGPPLPSSHPRRHCAGCGTSHAGPPGPSDDWKAGRSGCRNLLAFLSL